MLTTFSLQGSQFSKHSMISDSSQLTFLGCLSSSSYDVYVEEACEVVLAASGQELVSDSCYPDTETAALQNEDLRLLLELSSSESAPIERLQRPCTRTLCFLCFITPLLFTLTGSCKNASMQSEPDESLMSEVVLCLSEYTEDIHRHLRESEVRNCLNCCSIISFMLQCTVSKMSTVRFLSLLKLPHDYCLSL